MVKRRSNGINRLNAAAAGAAKVSHCLLCYMSHTRTLDAPLLVLLLLLLLLLVCYSSVPSVLRSL
jgi:hypothetical protein